MTRLSATTAVRTSYLDSKVQPHCPSGRNTEEDIRLARGYVDQGSKYIVIVTHDEAEDRAVQAFIDEMSVSYSDVKVEKRRHAHSV